MQNGFLPRKNAPEHGSACEALRQKWASHAEQSACRNRGRIRRGRSAGLSRAGRRFARWADALEDRDRRWRLWFIEKNRSDRRQKENSESRGVGRFRRSGESQRVVRSPVRCVMVSVRVMVVFTIMSILMQRGISDQGQRVVEMSLGCKMDGNETDVEREQQRGKQTPPPTRLVRRAA